MWTIRQFKESMCCRATFDLIFCKRYGACAWLETLVEECVNRDAEAVVFVVFGLAWGQFWNYHQSRYAAGVLARGNHWSAFDKVANDLGSGGLALPVKGFDIWERKASVSVFLPQFHTRKGGL